MEIGNLIRDISDELKYNIDIVNFYSSKEELENSLKA
jgi:hypothetical protein